MFLLNSKVTAEGRVEDWMNFVLKEMRKTNRLITKEAVYFYCAHNKTRYSLITSISCLDRIVQMLINIGK